MTHGETYNNMRTKKRNKYFENYEFVVNLNLASGGQQYHISLASYNDIYGYCDSLRERKGVINVRFELFQKHKVVESCIMRSLILNYKDEKGI